MIKALWHYFNLFFEKLIPAGDLLLRYWIWSIFFYSGLSKLNAWEVTLELFEYEYSVPILSASQAATLGTGVELIIPVLVLVGLGGRLPALILFIFNIMTVVSYPFLLTEDGMVGLKDHIHWGLLLLVIVLHGTGRWSLDNIIMIYRLQSENKR